VAVAASIFIAAAVSAVVLASLSFLLTEPVEAGAKKQHGRSQVTSPFSSLTTVDPSAVLGRYCMLCPRGSTPAWVGVFSGLHLVGDTVFVLLSDARSSPVAIAYSSGHGPDVGDHVSATSDVAIVLASSISSICSCSPEAEIRWRTHPESSPASLSDGREKDHGIN
jgi:hypothetical protein